CQTDIAFHPLRSLRTGVALRAYRAGIAFVSLRTHLSLGSLRPSMSQEIHAPRREPVGDGGAHGERFCCRAFLAAHHVEDVTGLADTLADFNLAAAPVLDGDGIVFLRCTNHRELGAVAGLDTDRRR